MAYGRPPGRAARRRRKTRLKHLRPSHPNALVSALAHYNRRFDEGHQWPMGTNKLWMELDPCVYCGHPDARTWDHIEPAARGYNKVENLARACARCNKFKYSTPLLRYLVERAHRRAIRGKPNFR